MILLCFTACCSTDQQSVAQIAAGGASGTGGTSGTGGASGMFSDTYYKKGVVG